MATTTPAPGIFSPDAEEPRPDDNAEALRNAGRAVKQRALKTRRKKPEPIPVFYDRLELKDVFSYLEEKKAEGQSVDKTKGEALLKALGHEVGSSLFNKHAFTNEQTALNLFKTFYDAVELESHDNNTKAFKIGETRLISNAGKHALEQSNPDGRVTFEQTLALYLNAMNDPAIKSAGNRMKLTGSDIERADMLKHIKEIEKTIAPEHRLTVQGDPGLKLKQRFRGLSKIFSKQAAEQTSPAEENSEEAAAARIQALESHLTAMQRLLEKSDRVKPFVSSRSSGEKELYEHTLYHNGKDDVPVATNLWFEKTDGGIKIIKAKRGADEYADPDADPRVIEMINGTVPTAAPDQNTPAPVTGGGTPYPDNEAPSAENDALPPEETAPSSDDASSLDHDSLSSDENEPDYPLNHRLQRKDIANSLKHIEAALNDPRYDSESAVQIDVLEKSERAVYSEYLFNDGEGEYRSDIRVFYIYEGTAFKAIGFNGADGSFYRDEDPKYRMVGDKAVSLTETPQPEAAQPGTTEVRKTHPPAPGPVATGTPSESPRNDFTFETGKNNSDENAEPVRRLTPEELREVSKGVTKHKVDIDPNKIPPQPKTVTKTLLQIKLPEIEQILNANYNAQIDAVKMLENDGRPVFEQSFDVEDQRGRIVSLNTSFIDIDKSFKVIAIDGSDGSIYRAEGAEYRIKGDTAVAAPRQIESATLAAASQQKAFGAQPPRRALPSCASAGTDFSAASTFLGEVDDRAMEALDRMRKQFGKDLSRTGVAALPAPGPAGMA